MPGRRRRIAPTALAVALLLLAAGLGQAAGGKEDGVAVGGKPDLGPVIPRGRGEACVADTPFMRRNHMTMLMHQRDSTVRQGVRSKLFSLSECVACHAVSGPDQQPVSIASPDHFCRACHDYAAVQIDCFQCHASRPDAQGPSLPEFARQ
jgi:hypothetical protein